jgi:hypothetical protein
MKGKDRTFDEITDPFQRMTFIHIIYKTSVSSSQGTNSVSIKEITQLRLFMLLVLGLIKNTETVLPKCADFTCYSGWNTKFHR